MAVTFQQRTLDNGLTIVGETDPGAHTAAVGFFVKTGARDESSDVMGVSHFLEHMMFKGTDDLSADQINQAFDAMGASNNAYTSGEMTCFYAKVLPEHLDIHVAVDVDARALEVTLGVRVRARVAQATQLVLHGVDLVGVQAEGASLRYTGTELTLGFEPPLARDEARELTLRYRVESPKSGVLFSSPEPHRPDAPRYAVTDHETERARHWLACIDLPAVRTTLAWHLRTPASFTALANGALVGEDVHEGGEKTTHYRLDTPCPSYLACFAVGEFVRADGEPVGDIPVASFAAAPFDAETLTRTFGRTSEMLTWMQGVLGPYPFPKYFQFAAEGIGGAMENISLVSWDDRFLLDEALATEETLLADIINVRTRGSATTWSATTTATRGSRRAGPRTWRPAGGSTATGARRSSTTSTAARRPTSRRSATATRGRS